MPKFGDTVCLTKAALRQKKLKDAGYRFVRACQDGRIVVQRCNVYAESTSPERWMAQEFVEPEAVAMILSARK